MKLEERVWVRFGEQQQLEEILHNSYKSFKLWTTVISLTGDNCRRFAERHEIIFNEVKAIIHDYVPSEITTEEGLRKFQQCVTLCTALCLKS